MKFPMEIPFSEIDSIPTLIKDFLAEKLGDFSENKLNKENISTAISNKKSFFSTPKREKLVNVLNQQYQGYELTDAQKKNIELLKNENTFTVTTGHQLNLFTGPSFFIYKILQTIKTAEFIRKNFSDTAIVPIFWLASEDHDFEEINHFKTPYHHYEIKGNSGGPVGRIPIDDTLFINEFENEFKDFPYGKELISQIKKAYTQGNTLTEATRQITQWLFSEWGLLCIDGDNPELKSEMKNIFEKELLQQSLQKYTKNRIDFLIEKYGKAQVNPHEINLFYLSENRNRIEYNGEKYQILDTPKSLSKEEILQELNLFPEKFSPNALMRPIYQENILPNIAYIGGNAEIAYWLELKDFFFHLQIPFPILVPRNSMVFISSKTLGKIEKVGLEITDFFKNFAQVVQKELLKNQPLEEIIHKKEEEIKNIFEELISQSSLTDKSFKNLVEAEKTRQLKSYQKMRKRLIKAEKIKQSEKFQYLEYLFYEIHPSKTWQERIYNFSIFYAYEGKDWLKSCYNKMNIEESVLIISEI